MECGSSVEAPFEFINMCKILSLVVYIISAFTKPIRISIELDSYFCVGSVVILISCILSFLWAKSIFN